MDIRGTNGLSGPGRMDGVQRVNRIAKAYPKVKPDAHAAEVLADVAALNGAAPAAPAKKKPTPVPAQSKAAAKPRGAPRARRARKPKT